MWTGLPCQNLHLLVCCAILDSEKQKIMEENYGFNEILKVNAVFSWDRNMLCIFLDKLIFKQILIRYQKQFRTLLLLLYRCCCDVWLLVAFPHKTTIKRTQKNRTTKKPTHQHHTVAIRNKCSSETNQECVMCLHVVSQNGVHFG